jgi:AsmA family protein
MANPLRRIPRPAWWAFVLASVLVVALAAFLSWFKWDMLRGPIARQASLALGRPVRIDGDLVVHPWSLTPVATVGGIKVGNPAWMKGGDLADIRSLTVSVKLWPLLFGHLDVPLIRADQPKVALYRDASGRNNWQVGRAGGRPLELPPIHEFAIHDGHISLQDLTRQLTVVGVMQSNETPGGGRGTFHLTGNGTLKREPFSVTIAGGPLLEVRRDRPYPFQADVRTGSTRVLADGEVLRPFNFGQLRTDLTVSGADFADLYDLTGLAFPTTPPYALHGELIRNDSTYTFRHVAGRVGASDLEGVFTVTHHGQRPNLSADLHSRSLRLADLGTLVGAPPAQPVKAVQRIEAARLAIQDRILPDTQLDLQRVRATDADVHYRAQSLYARANLPLTAFAMHVTLNHGVLNVDPLAFGMPHGALTGRVRIDARPATPLSDVDLRVTNLHAEDFFRGQAEPPLDGVVEARALLHGAGGSVHAVASSADGDVTVVEPHGQIRKALAELLGINVVRGLGLLWSKDQSETGVRCAVADFQANHGVLTARTLVFDTDPVLATGKGSIDLHAETVDLTLEGHPKHFQLIRLMSPITVGGHLKTPKLGVRAGAAPVQLVAAVGLGALFSPLAAILPFVDPGLAKNADCAGLIAGAQAHGAPLRIASIAH